MNKQMKEMQNALPGDHHVHCRYSFSLDFPKAQNATLLIDWLISQLHDDILENRELVQ